MTEVIATSRSRVADRRAHAILHQANPPRLDAGATRSPDAAPAPTPPRASSQVLALARPTSWLSLAVAHARACARPRPIESAACTWSILGPEPREQRHSALDPSRIKGVIMLFGWRLVLCGCCRAVASTQGDARDAAGGLGALALRMRERETERERPCLDTAPPQTPAMPCHRRVSPSTALRRTLTARSHTTCSRCHEGKLTSRTPPPRRPRPRRARARSRRPPHGRP